MSIYDITLRTPLGKKKGELEAKIENGNLSGTLSLFGHSEPIEGTVDAAGNCFLKGKMITLMSSISFTASGTLNEKTLQLNVQGHGGHYVMVGTLRTAEEDECP
ncbi:MAG: hypothetical protein ACI3YH_03380 [Eubacteriales bacterium]